MLTALDLTANQVARVLTQAVRTKARLEIEPRPEAQQRVWIGGIESREGNLLRVEMDGPGGEAAAAALIGAFCDVRTVLSGELYMFSTCIVDAIEENGRTRLLLAAPSAIQLSNRRRHIRKAPSESIAVRLGIPSVGQSFDGDLHNVGMTGLACRMPRSECDEILLLGDEVDLRFDFPWLGETFELAASVATKSISFDEQSLIVGLEFSSGDGARAQHATLQRLRSLLCTEITHLHEIEGEQ